MSYVCNMKILVVCFTGMTFLWLHDSYMINILKFYQTFCIIIHDSMCNIISFKPEVILTRHTHTHTTNDIILRHESTLRNQFCGFINVILSQFIFIFRFINVFSLNFKQFFLYETHIRTLKNMGQHDVFTCTVMIAICEHTIHIYR